ncbi:MAG: deoxyribodipyrimidine photo-lyase [Candidatus Eisenbacteria bacterium]|nr:deoxyribodipyrimidine photo-lyase [Candidatus Eisenbacteria bacterium]
MPAIHWFRKDLRLDDNTALAAAVADSGGDVVTAYVSEPTILARPDMAAVRLRFVLDCLADLSLSIDRLGGRLILRHGDAADELLKLARECGAHVVHANAEYEPDLMERDRVVEERLAAAGIRLCRHHDRFLVAPGAVRNAAGEPFVVYSPFRKASEPRGVGPTAPTVDRLTIPRDGAGQPIASRRLATLEDLGEKTDQDRWPPGAGAARQALRDFAESALFDYIPDRDRLDKPGTSRLSHHLRFGTISPRQVYHAVSAALESPGAAGGRHADINRSAAGADARKSVEHYISELRWRDFYGQVMYHFPHVVGGSFRRPFDAIRWVSDEPSWQAWCEGRTGYPVVDAAMRQLRASGWMHNRARMIVASFLTKDLLIDWRRGERWFMNHLVDGDPASNNGGWQWAAGTGTDAQPYFRIFNPVLQGKKFDPDGAYVRRWVPELAELPAALIHDPWTATSIQLAVHGVTLGENYPQPICDHAERRGLALALYQEARSGVGRIG